MKQTLKMLFEKIMYVLFATRTDRIYNKIDNYDYVSFDIFDTLIKRNVKNPENVFDIIEQKNVLKDFKKKRLQAQKKAIQNTKREEITLNEIYKNFENISEYEKNSLFKLEVDTEKDVCSKKNEIFEIYRYCLEHDKKIYIISDMYLPLYVIENILKENGYERYDRIVLSSDVMYTKRTGSIFKFVLKSDKIDNRKIVHIGDHPLSDYINPRKFGIQSILIRK